jgi:hypothetical protein
MSESVPSCEQRVPCLAGHLPRHSTLSAGRSEDKCRAASVNSSRLTPCRCRTCHAALHAPTPEPLNPQITQVSDMLEAGHQPDTFTYAALLSACQRAEEAELAFDILK